MWLLGLGPGPHEPLRQLRLLSPRSCQRCWNYPNLMSPTQGSRSSSTFQISEFTLQKPVSDACSGVPVIGGNGIQTCWRRYVYSAQGSSDPGPTQQALGRLPPPSYSFLCYAQVVGVNTLPLCMRQDGLTPDMRGGTEPIAQPRSP